MWSVASRSVSNRIKTRSRWPCERVNSSGCRAPPSASWPIRFWTRRSNSAARSRHRHMDAEKLREYLTFYQDLGFTSLYRRNAIQQLDQEGDVTPAVEPVPESPSTLVALPSLAPAGDTLARIREDIAACKRCRLHEARHSILFGSGNPQTKLVIVGEGPGADEDAQGLPFVGRAGQLLTQMIEGTAKREGIPILRKDVYICNVVKCRPPENRTPEPDEMEICGQFLFRQLSAIRPKAICSLGPTSAHAFLPRK